MFSFAEERIFSVSFLRYPKNSIKPKLYLNGLFSIDIPTHLGSLEEFEIFYDIFNLPRLGEN